MENIIEVVEAKIKELNSSLDYIRQEEAKTAERKAVIIVKIGALERELEELKGAPKKRVRTSGIKTIIDASKDIVITNPRVDKQA